jgi:hypothetical protein
MNSKKAYNMEPRESFLPNLINVSEFSEVYKEKCRNINSEDLLFWLAFVMHANLEENE